MKVSIPAYPGMEITEEAFQRDVANTPEAIHDGNRLPNHMSIIQESNNTHRIVNGRPVDYQGNQYLAPFPNPIHLYLSLAIEHYNHSEKQKEQKFASCGKQMGEKLFMLSADDSGTHECYNEYLKYRMSAVIMAVCSIEAFINYTIPSDFIYKTVRRGNSVSFNKVEIEEGKVSFREKIEYVIPELKGDVDFWKDNLELKENVIELYQLRSKLVHLKSNTVNDFVRYFYEIDSMLDMDIFYKIKGITKLMNVIQTDFITFRIPKNE